MSKNRCIQNIPLSGTQLIEASAGTGKTYNLTELYVRLILEKELSINRILVGTNIAGVYLTNNRGVSWRRILGKMDLKPLMDNMALSTFARARYPATIWAVKFDHRDLYTVYVGHSPDIHVGMGILRSLDLGKTWSQLTDPSICLGSIRSIALDERSGSIMTGGFELCRSSF